MSDPISSNFHKLSIKDDNKETSKPKAQYQVASNRYHICDMEGRFPPEFVRVARTIESGVGCLIPTNFLIPGNEGGSFKLSDQIMTLDQYVLNLNGFPLVNNHPSAKKPIAADVTVFRVGPDMLMSAGHSVANKGNVLSTKKISHSKVIFGFQKKKPVEPGSDGIVRYFDRRNVYTIKCVMNFSYSGNNDFSLFKTTRVMSDHIFTFQFNMDKPNKGTFLGIIGHPDGGPKEIAANGEVLREEDEYSYKAKITASHGNSGSPIIDETGKVRGILIQGEDDHIISVQNGKIVMIDNIVTDATAKYYETCRYITPEMFDSAERLYRNATKAITIISEVKSKKAEDDAKENGYEESNIKKIKKIYEETYAQKLSLRLNALAAHLISPHMPKNPTLYEAMYFAHVAEFMVAFGVSFEVASTIEHINSNLDGKFSPLDILEVIKYQTKNIKLFPREKIIEILEYMTAFNHKTQTYFTVKEALEEMENE